MTDLTEIEEAITASLATITKHWDDLMVPNSGGGNAGPRAPRALITLPDHDPSDADIDRATVIVAIRRLTTDVLNGWSRVVMEDRPVVKALPNGKDVPAMAAFLTRHAQWVSGHDAAEDMVGELEDLARKVVALTTPRRKEWMALGSCPLETEFDPEQGLEVCGGQVRAWPRAEDREGETMARCQRCGTEAVASWWERKMFTDPELRQWLTDAELVPFLHSTFGIVVKEATIRQWVKRDVLRPSGKDDHGRRLFNREAVVYAMHQREKRERVGSVVSDIKRACPACDSWTSSVGIAFRDGDPCPYCGLPAEVVPLIDAAEARGVERAVLDRLAKAEQRATIAEAELAHTKSALESIRDSASGW